mmetsp:Transcript_34097/g.78187  ORF Transcript_34097/g.78187 Transcript_34097/m.78187 type:complete len:107 (-) Transcript_34097:651-971(-)
MQTTECERRSPGNDGVEHDKLSEFPRSKLSHLTFCIALIVSYAFLSFRKIESRWFSSGTENVSVAAEVQQALLITFIEKKKFDPTSCKLHTSNTSSKAQELVTDPQ